MLPHQVENCQKHFLVSVTSLCSKTTAHHTFRIRSAHLYNSQPHLWYSLGHTHQVCVRTELRHCSVRTRSHRDRHRLQMKHREEQCQTHSVVEQRLTLLLAPLCLILLCSCRVHVLSDGAVVFMFLTPKISALPLSFINN